MSLYDDLETFFLCLLTFSFISELCLFKFFTIVYIKAMKYDHDKLVSLAYFSDLKNTDLQRTR